MGISGSDIIGFVEGERDGKRWVWVLVGLGDVVGSNFLKRSFFVIVWLFYLSLKVA